MSYMRDVIEYLRYGRDEFRHQVHTDEVRAEEAYQGSMASAMEATREATKVRTSVDFLRKVMQGHEQH